ncbi:hypothetical protein [Natronorubrum sp. DTA28]|uniref:hypothetical protein n=1 Tax=Natronorubrum sp. DTA28 TaxID=3447019 RepID=UPI003F826454
MKRREIATVTGIALSQCLVGCLDRDDASSSNGSVAPSEIVNQELKIISREELDNSGPSVDEPPAITINETESQIEIVGRISYGQSNCNEIGFGDVNIDTSSNDLIIDVNVQEIDTDDDCHSDLKEETYRGKIELDEGVPDVITVGEYGPNYSFEETKP